MNKPAIALAGALAVALLGLPPLLGMVTESQVTRRVESLQDHPLLAAELQSFDRGWFGSQARIELGLSPAYTAQIAAQNPDVPADALERRAVVLVDVAHGPVAVGRGVHFGLSSFVARPDPDTESLTELLERLGIPYLFEFRGRTGLSGALDFDADMPGFELAEPGSQVSFAGATLEGSLDGTALAYRARADRLRLAESGSASLSIEGMRSSGDLDVRSRYLVLGSFGAEVDRLQVWDPAAAPLFDATKLRMQGEWRPGAADDRLDASVTYTLERAQAGDDGEIADAAFGMTVRNIDVPALHAYSETMQHAMQNGDTDPQQLLADIGPILARLLAASPSISIEPARFQWQGERFDGSVLIEIDGGALPPAAAFDPSNPVFWLTAVDATARATVSKELAEDVMAEAITMQLASVMGGDAGLQPEEIENMARAQAGLMLVSLIGQGLLVDDGESYSSRLEFRDGAVTVNGNPLPAGLP